MDTVDNNTENKEYKLGGVTGKGFMPGVSGNPGGRPKGTLKDFVKRRFMAMTDEEKMEWLESNKIAGIDQWKMGEGNPTSEDTLLVGELPQPILNVQENNSDIKDTEPNQEN